MAAEGGSVPARGDQQRHADRHRRADPARQTRVAARERQHPECQGGQHDRHRSLGEDAERQPGGRERGPTAAATADEGERPRGQHRRETGRERHVDAGARRRPNPLEAGREDERGR